VIFGHRENRIIREAVFRGEETEFGISKPVQSAICADPQSLRPVLEQRRYHIALKFRSIAFIKNREPQPVEPH